MSDLAVFEKRKAHKVMPFVTKIFSGAGRQGSYVLKLISFEDGHFRVVFKSSYFGMEDGREPSKSQWSGLKKKFKRHDHRVFLFKQHGVVPCETVGAAEGEEGVRCLYLDFGFFLE